MSTGQLQQKRFDDPDETRLFTDGKGRVDIVTVGDTPIGLGRFEPGWRWSINVKPMAGTDSCQVLHTGYVISGRMAVRMDNGEEREFGPGDAFLMPSGHDAWIVGEEPCELVDFTGMRTYAATTRERPTGEERT
jgi:cupin domain